jgi:hypothetical protein
MKSITILFSVLVVFFLTYQICIIYILIRLRKKLTGNNLNTFQTILGIPYEKRNLNSDFKRCKWSTPLYCVKANFDKEGEFANYSSRLKLEKMYFWSLSFY